MDKLNLIIAYHSLLFTETKIGLNTEDGIILLASYNEDEYSWKIEKNDLDLESLNSCLQNQVNGHVILIEGVKENIYHSLAMDFSGILQQAFVYYHTEYMRFQKTIFNKLVKPDFETELEAQILLMKKIVESPAVLELKLDIDSVESTLKLCLELQKCLVLLNRYDSEFKRIHQKLLDIKGENEELSKKKEIYTENYSQFVNGKIIDGILLEDENFTMDKEHVIKLLSEKFSSFSEVVGILHT